MAWGRARPGCSLAREHSLNGSSCGLAGESACPTWLLAGGSTRVEVSELRSDGQAGRPVLRLIHAAHAGSGTASAGGAGRHFGALGGAVGVGGEGGEFLLKMLLAAGWADESVRVGGAADQLFELGSAIGTKVFVDWHGVVSPYSNIRVQ